ncbi:RNA polymerase sigma factor [Dactylosporangium aurantiacum]|uniref:RNA polymerase sigma factor n=1 Tax=Dactylosporangium aurantiacum TaxID=35754 RepID=A0A9Q9ITG5_9ACTN|nr:RNA polymerase sigma factor [Dactylosporangium aurantiacum]MDG6105863.1 RNA polymerase sigma factor [Dactylosporangium aurantiacum]UWZ59615.1 RNA polymerase sigma factor [Dactylosporangium aurantiacum]
MSQADEEALLRRTARGDRAAFEEFYRRTAPWLAVRLRRRCADQDIVAEVMQDAYVAVWRAAAGYAGTAAGGSAAGWLWTIAARRLVDAYRVRARRDQPVPAPLASDVTAPAAEDEVVGPVLDDPVAGAVRELAPELREVVQAMVLDGLSVRETSVLLGVPEGTVKTRARRARTLLREVLS